MYLSKNTVEKNAIPDMLSKPQPEKSMSHVLKKRLRMSFVYKIIYADNNNCVTSVGRKSIICMAQNTNKKGAI